MHSSTFERHSLVQVKENKQINITPSLLQQTVAMSDASLLKPGGQ